MGPLVNMEQTKPARVHGDAVLTPTTRTTRDLIRLPPPKFKVPVAVYAFRDQTGQFKPQPDSNLSNAVTQGAASIVVKALLDSGWYLPIEREGFQNLLTERRVAKALESPTDNGKPGSSYPSLMAANFLIEGGIVGYESNVRTGGDGANLLGIGGDVKYRMDQVTVNLRSVDVRSGQIINSVSVTKTVFSYEVSASVYKFVAYKTLLQAEGGYSTNEPTHLAVKEAIESAVIHLTVQGIRDGAWSLRNPKDWESSMVQGYLRAAEMNVMDDDQAQAAVTTNDEAPAPVPVRASSMMLPPMPPLSIVPPRVMPNKPAPVAAAAGEMGSPPVQTPAAPMQLPTPPSQARKETAPLSGEQPAQVSELPNNDAPPASNSTRQPLKEVPLPQAQEKPAAVIVQSAGLGASAPPLLAPLSGTRMDPSEALDTVWLAQSSR